MHTDKAKWQSHDDNFTLTMPIAKIDKEKRIVSGFGTLNNVDRQGDIVKTEASRKAFAEWAGNVRMMHDKVPAGKAVDIVEKTFTDENGNEYEGFFVDVYISKGAPNVWEMILDETLKGFSIGGAIKDWDMEKVDGQSVRIIKEYELNELSLVDVPANSYAKIMSVQKSADGAVAIESIYDEEVSESSVTIEEENEMLKLVRSIWSIVSKSNKGGEDELTETAEAVEKAIVQPNTASVKQRDEREVEPEKADEPVAADKVEEDEPVEVEKSYDDLVEEIKGLAGHMTTVVGVVEKLANRVAELEKSNDKGNITKALDEIVGRLKAVESDTATKQSGEIAKSTVVTKPRKQDIWGGAILNTSDL